MSEPAAVQEPKRWRHALSVLACAVFAALLCAPPFLADIPSHSYHVDEDVWIYGAYYHRLFFKEKNFESKDWSHINNKFNGPMAKYVLAVGFDVSGIEFQPTMKDIDGWWPANEHLPEKSPRLHPQILHAGRRTCALLGLCSAVLLFFIAYAASGRLAAIFAALFFSYNILVLSTCRHSMADAPLLFFATAAVFVMVLLVGALRDPWKYKFALPPLVVLEAFLIGSAVGTKFNGALVSFAFVITITITALAFAIHRRPGADSGELRRWWKRLLGAFAILLMGVGVGVASFAVFTYFNPYLHTDPIGRTREMYEVTTKHLAETISKFPEDALSTFSAKAGYVWMEIGQGREIFLPKAVSSWVNGAIMVLGVLVLTGKTVWTLVRGRPGGELVAWTWLLVAAAGVVFWIPVDWDRYLTPLLPAASVAAGVGFGEALLFCGRLVRGRTPAPSIGAESSVSTPPPASAVESRA
ncbi:MAG TPA: phospholipid carrier-dependent glycosyltransferase [Planctomycetota bacterium]|nr:phospholipid carrier-dependent glycosyltransferase [Planctomycetota bacterium]